MRARLNKFSVETETSIFERVGIIGVRSTMLRAACEINAEKKQPKRDHNPPKQEKERKKAVHQIISDSIHNTHSLQID